MKKEKPYKNKPCGYCHKDHQGRTFCKNYYLDSMSSEEREKQRKIKSETTSSVQPQEAENWEHEFDVWLGVKIDQGCLKQLKLSIRTLLSREKEKSYHARGVVEAQIKGVLIKEAKEATEDVRRLLLEIKQTRIETIRECMDIVQGLELKVGGNYSEVKRGFNEALKEITKKLQELLKGKGRIQT